MGGSGDQYKIGYLGGLLKSTISPATRTRFRFYNPLPSFFDKSWRPGEIEEAE